MSNLELDVFEMMLKNHDWTYEYSDDHRYYTKGRDSAQKIRVMRERLNDAGLGKEATELYNKYLSENV